jgi:hypothetical protein
MSVPPFGRRDDANGVENCDESIGVARTIDGSSSLVLGMLSRFKDDSIETFVAVCDLEGSRKASG